MKKENIKALYEKRRDLAIEMYEGDQLKKELQYIDSREKAEKDLRMSNRLHNKINLYGAVVIIIGTVFAMVLPENVLSSVLILKKFSNYMASIIPSINHMVAVSKFPEATHLFLSIVWFLMPFNIIIIYFLFPNVCLFHRNLYKKKPIITTIIYLVFLPAIVYYLVFRLGSDTEYIKKGGYYNFPSMMSESRFMLGIFSTMVLVVAIPLTMNMVFCWLKELVARTNKKL